MLESRNSNVMSPQTSFSWEKNVLKNWRYNYVKSLINFLHRHHHSRSCQNIDGILRKNEKSFSFFEKKKCEPSDSFKSGFRRSRMEIRGLMWFQNCCCWCCGCCYSYWCWWWFFLLELMILFFHLLLFVLFFVWL